MLSPSVFVALIEVRPLEGGILNPNIVEGAAVRCYIPAGTSDAARQLLRESLKRDLLELVEIEWCVNNEEVEWENPTDETAARMIEDARSHNEVIYGDFHTWGHNTSDE